jgi:hypothetical protein
MLLYTNGIRGLNKLLSSQQMPTLMYTMVMCKPSIIYLSVAILPSIG